VIVFFKRKVDAHRMKILFSLMGIEAAELHGNLTQVQVRGGGEREMGEGKGEGGRRGREERMCTE
jgi:hypothetical protein